MSAKKRTKTPGAGGSGNSGDTPFGTAKKQRSGDLGRALRSAYDDTLREPVPNDFLDLIGKLD